MCELFGGLVFAVPSEVPRGHMDARAAPREGVIDAGSAGVGPENVGAIHRHVLTQPLERMLDPVIDPVGRETDELRRDPGGYRRGRRTREAAALSMA